MIGINATTGKALAGVDHLRQSVRDILTTPVGSRVMRRDYGSQLPRLVDAPLNRSTLADVYAETADALGRWEPRLRLLSVSASMLELGVLTLTLVGQYLPDGREIVLDGVEVRA